MNVLQHVMKDCAIDVYKKMAPISQLRLVFVWKEACAPLV
jgi:hypothetical protein